MVLFSFPSSECLPAAPAEAATTTTTATSTTTAETAAATAAASSTAKAAAAETAATPAEAATTAGRTAATSPAETAAATTTADRATSASAETATATAGLLDLGCSRWGLGPGQELLEREELLRADEELVAWLEAGRLDALAGFYGEVYLVDGAEDLVDLADGCLVLEEDLRVEVRHLGVDALAHHLALAGVHEAAHLEDLIGGTEVALSETTAAYKSKTKKSES